MYRLGKPKLEGNARELGESGCFAEDVSDLDEFSDAQIIKRAHRHYDGGITEFLRTVLTRRTNTVSQ